LSACVRAGEETERGEGEGKKREERVVGMGCESESTRTSVFFRTLPIGARAHAFLPAHPPALAP
jgi:hypothetical protein